MEKIALNAVIFRKFEDINGKLVVKDLWHRSRLTLFCACTESYVVFSIVP